MSDWKLHNIIMRYFLRYLETNKWYKYQKYIVIAKKIDIYVARFEFKKSEKINKYSSTGQVSTTAERAKIVK